MQLQEKPEAVGTFAYAYAAPVLQPTQCFRFASELLPRQHCRPVSGYPSKLSAATLAKAALGFCLPRTPEGLYLSTYKSTRVNKRPVVLLLPC